MEKKLIPFDEYPQLYEETKGNVHLLNIHCTVKFAMDKCFEGSTMRVFKVCEGEEKLYSIALEMLDGANLICMFQSDSHCKEFLHRATILVLSSLQETFEKYETFLCNSLAEKVAEAVHFYFDKLTNSHPYVPMNEKAQMFYANEKQQKQLLKADLILPEGFEYRVLEVEDAKVITEEIVSVKWPRELDIIGSKLAHLPSMGIVHKESGDLACYEANDGTGFLSYLYTRHRFRRLGLARLIEQKLSIENMQKHKIPPYKAVAMSRPRVITMSHESYLWTVVPDVDGKECAYWWVSRSKRPQEAIVFYED